jgi:hypothetical protein
MHCNPYRSSPKATTVGRVCSSFSASLRAFFKSVFYKNNLHLHASPLRTGYVHFGDIVMLFNQATDGCLACDPQETLSDETFATTSTWYTEPCARNTFVMRRWEGRGDKKDAMFDFKDDVVHFGQKIQLVCNPVLIRGQEVWQALAATNMS